MANQGVSYDGPEDAKKIDLASPGEDSKHVYIATDLEPEEEKELIEILQEFRDVFAWSYKDLKGVDPAVCQHTIPLRDDAKPSKQRPYSYNDNYPKKIEEEINILKEAGFIYKIEHTEWVSPLVVVPKKNGKLRVCVNLKKVNTATIRDHYPLPITDHVIEQVARAEAYSFLDGFSGYNQLSIAPEDQHKTAFATERGTFAYRVMPFGLTNAPSTFQRLMSHIFREFLRKFLEIYVDDLCVHSQKRKEHLSQLRKIFEKCRLYRLCLNPEKCVFMVRQGKILGHIVSKNVISTDEEKIQAIVSMPRPINARGVQAFMGHCGYYRRIIYQYASIAQPLYALIVAFEWTNECIESFEKLRKALIDAPILRAPDWNKVFHVHIDASNFAIGCVLAQPGEHNMDFPVSYASRQLNSAEKNYTTTEREGLGMVYAVKKYRHYLLANKFVFFTDHQALLYLVNKPRNTGRIVRWFPILLEFDFTVVVKKGITHQRADHLSRLTNGELPIGVQDDLPDAYLFNVEMVPKWSKDVVPFLTMGTLRLSDSMEANLASVVNTQCFSILAGRLYHKGRDNILHLCIDKEETATYMECAHIAVGNLHLTPTQTLRRIGRMGVYWKTISKDVHEYIRGCCCQMGETPVVFKAMTLYKLNPSAPKWAEAMVEYMTTKVMPEKTSKVKQRYLEKHVKDYSIIANQLYHRGKDGSLRICVTEAEYLEVLFHAHSCLPGGHFSAEVTTKAIMVWIVVANIA
ncbi:hypothetical protein L7F22_014182 [Adiantum nelumboides]|nr:hypothetical protein [Adiantum nelumboides]